MTEKLRLWNQYGFKPDVFDKYHESVRRSNQGSIQVFSVLAIVSSIMVSCSGLITSQPRTGLFFCLMLLASGVYGAVVSFRKGKNCPRKKLLQAGYFLSITTHLISIYGTFLTHSDVFWVGALVTVACYLFDYAWRVSVLQIASFIALTISWSEAGINPDLPRVLFCFMYLVISLMTFYTLNRARVNLIAGQQESQIKADTDLLTGLTMRTAAQQEIELHLKSDEHGVMLLLDLDGFKSVNDRLGHQMGDRVLIEVAADLKKMFRNSDVLSRLGGDEFVIYMKNVSEREWAQQRASQVVREVRRWVGNGTTNIQITASIGIVMTDMVERSYDELYHAADIAMYSAKSQGGNKALFFTSEMSEHARETEDERHMTGGKDKTEEETNSLR